MPEPVPEAKRPITVSEYHAMDEAGRFARPERVELLAGEIHEAASIGSRHAACLSNLNRLFLRHLAEKVIVRAQCPIQLDDLSEPQPDLALVAWRRHQYAEAHPRPEDVLLLVEISATTYDFDRGLKLPLYAAAGIAEVWIVRLETETIEAYRGPAGRSYQHVEHFTRDQQVAPQLLPETTLEVSNILP